MNSPEKNSNWEGIILMSPSFANESYQCPCCGYYTLEERGRFEICSVCFWEDDDPTERVGQPAPERPQGPNRVHLWQARENFKVYGVAEVDRFSDDFSVWVFTGSERPTKPSAFPGAVFSNRARAEWWIERYQVTGT